MSKALNNTSLVYDILTKRHTPEKRAELYAKHNNRCKALKLTEHTTKPQGVCAYPAGWPA